MTNWLTNWLRASFSRLAGLWRGETRESEVAAELESHLQLHIDDNLRAGMTAERARREAILKLGGVESTKQFCRERNTVPFFDNLFQDTRFAMRQLRKNRAFTGTAIFVLALGMCASIAIFAFVDAALLKPLPYKDPKRLLGVFEKIQLFPQSNLSYPDYLDWKKRNTVFSSLDIYGRNGVTLRTASGVEPVRTTRVSDGFFHTLGVTPVLGRDFRSGEDLPSAQRTLLLTYAAWQKRYNGKKEVLGQTVTLDDHPYTVIGVLPSEFQFAPGEPAEFWVAFHAESECDLRRSCHSIYGVGRLKDGVSSERALANLTSIAQQLQKEYPENLGQGANVVLLSDVIVGFIRPVLLVLLGGSALLLLIAGVNVVSLLLVRTESRKREIAVRSALGAGRARLNAQFVTEGLVLAIAGSVLGILAAFWVMKFLTSLISADILASMPYFQGLSLNPRVLLFAAGIAILASILFSLTPALHFATPHMSASFAEGTRGSSGNTWRRLGSKLVVLELATAMILLVAAGLLGKSLYLMLHVDAGFAPDHLSMLSLAAPVSTYPKDVQQIALARKVTNRIAALPGIKSVGVSSDLPVEGWGDTTYFRIVGRPWHGEHNETPERDVSSAYFATIGARLLRGRAFTDAEDRGKPLVAIINRSLEKRYFPNEDPLGKQLSGLSDKAKPMEIVGIVDDIKEGPLNTPNQPVLYLPFNQDPGQFFNVVVRTSQAEESLIPTMSAAIRQIDPGIVTFNGKTMHDQVNQSTYLPRMAASLVGGFATMALLLGVVGLYGVVAYSVSQRTREIGVRMALGAERRSVYELILKEAGWLTLAGIMIGLVCAMAAARLISFLLFGVNSWDAATLIVVASVLGIAAILASFIPARRAASVNPLEALRVE
jgi:predicted permease